MTIHPNQQPLLDIESLMIGPIISNIEEANLRLTADFSSISKFDTLREYQKHVRKGREHYATERIKVTHVVNLTNKEYDHFIGHLLDDYDWMRGMGGFNSDMENQPSTGTFLDWTPEQQAEFRRKIYRLVAAVQARDRETIFIDPQGYTYPRYVGL